MSVGTRARGVLWPFRGALWLGTRTGNKTLQAFLVYILPVFISLYRYHSQTVIQLYVTGVVKYTGRRSRRNQCVVPRQDQRAGHQVGVPATGSQDVRIHEY